MLFFLNRENGYIALSTVLVVLSVIVAISLVSTYSSIGEAQSGLSLFKGDESLSSVEGCVEDALLKARSNSTFGEPTGTPVTILRPSPESNCSVTVNSKTGSGTVTWDVNITNDSVYKRTIKVIFTRSSSQITLTSWNEI